MTGRLFDFDGHPWSEDGWQGFRIADDSPDGLTEIDRLRLTDRATGYISYWQVDKAVRTDKGWRGVLTALEL